MPINEIPRAERKHRGSTRRRSARHSWSCVERVGERHSRNGKGHTHAYRVTGNLFTPGIHGIRKSYQRREHSLLCKIAIPRLEHAVTKIILRFYKLKNIEEFREMKRRKFQRKMVVLKTEKTMHVHGEYVYGGLILKIKIQMFR